MENLFSQHLELPLKIKQINNTLNAAAKINQNKHSFNDCHSERSTGCDAEIIEKNNSIKEMNYSLLKRTNNPIAAISKLDSQPFMTSNTSAFSTFIPYSNASMNSSQFSQVRPFNRLSNSICSASTLPGTIPPEMYNPETVMSLLNRNSIFSIESMTSTYSTISNDYTSSKQQQKALSPAEAEIAPSTNLFFNDPKLNDFLTHQHETNGISLQNNSNFHFSGGFNSNFSKNHDNVSPGINSQTIQQMSHNENNNEICDIDNEKKGQYQQQNQQQLLTRQQQCQMLFLANALLVNNKNNINNSKKENYGRNNNTDLNHKAFENINSKNINSNNESVSLELCVVCGDKASGRHYGAISCEGCKGFFKRSIRKQIAYICRGEKDCLVTKFHRNRCQFCRLRKCIMMGMKSESVQAERRPMNAALAAAAACVSSYSLASPNNAISLSSMQSVSSSNTISACPYQDSNTDAPNTSQTVHKITSMSYSSNNTMENERVDAKFLKLNNGMRDASQPQPIDESNSSFNLSEQSDNLGLLKIVQNTENKSDEPNIYKISRDKHPSNPNVSPFNASFNTPVLPLNNTFPITALALAAAIFKQDSSNRANSESSSALDADSSRLNFSASSSSSSPAPSPSSSISTLSFSTSTVSSNSTTGIPSPMCLLSSSSAMIFNKENAKFVVHVPDGIKTEKSSLSHLCETVSRILFLTLQWIKQIPLLAEKQNLVRDRLSLGWRDVFVLGLLQCAETLNFPQMLYEISNCLDNECAESNKLKSEKYNEIRQQIHTLIWLMDYSSQLKIRDIEYAYLKLITFTSPDPMVSINDNSAVYDRSNTFSSLIQKDDCNGKSGTKNQKNIVSMESFKKTTLPINKSKIIDSFGKLNDMPKISPELLTSPNDSKPTEDRDFFASFNELASQELFQQILADTIEIMGKRKTIKKDLKRRINKSKHSENSHFLPVKVEIDEKEDENGLINSKSSENLQISAISESMKDSVYNGSIPLRQDEQVKEKFVSNKQKLENGKNKAEKRKRDAIILRNKHNTAPIWSNTNTMKNEELFCADSIRRLKIFKAANRNSKLLQLLAPIRALNNDLLFELFFSKLIDASMPITTVIPFLYSIDFSEILSGKFDYNSQT